MNKILKDLEIEEIIARIGYIRSRAGLSGRELSLRIGKNDSYISRLEYKKDFNPSIKTLKDILLVCNTTFEEFFYYDINQYNVDKELINKFKTLSEEKKNSLLNLIK